MTTVTQISEKLRELFGPQAERLGRETGFIQRERTLSASAFAQASVFGWLQEPTISKGGTDPSARTAGGADVGARTVEAVQSASGDVLSAPLGAGECLSGAGVSRGGRVVAPL
jgi:hypothetical protein